MTEHLYYEDAYLTSFSATVLEQLSVGGSPAVVLDRTAFYPTSGGQPHDRGALGPARVVSVEEDAAGRIVHALDVPLAPGPVEGRIDWERRFDHMQQHTGQHILSQAFVQAARAATVSFHLGPETSTIDVDMPQPDPGAICAAEELATRIVMEDRPVSTISVDRSELSALGVRKESQREGLIRVIDVHGFDRSPCGGTHVRRSGEIGFVSVLGSERYKGGTRIEFVCGLRAFRLFRHEHGTLKQLGRLFSAHPDELPRLGEKLLAEQAAARRANAQLQEQLLDFEASNLVQVADKYGEVFLVKRVYSGRPVEEVKLLAQKASARARVVAILGTVAGGSGQIVVARAADIPGSAGSWVKEAASRLGGRGGGRPEFAQAGGIEEATLNDWIETVAAAFRTALQAPEG